MAEGNYYAGDGIVKLIATETMTKVGMKVDHIVLAGTAAGSFVLVIGGATLTIVTGANDLSKVIPIGRTVGFLELTSGPTAATLYAFLEKK